MSKRAATDLFNLGFQTALEAAIEETETYALDNPDAWERGFADGCASVRASLRRLLADALAAAAPQSGDAKAAQRPKDVQ